MPSAKFILIVSLNVRIQGGGSWAMWSESHKWFWHIFTPSLPQLPTPIGLRLYVTSFAFCLEPGFTLYALLLHELNTHWRKTWNCPHHLISHPITSWPRCRQSFYASHVQSAEQQPSPKWPPSDSLGGRGSPGLKGRILELCDKCTQVRTQNWLIHTGCSPQKASGHYTTWQVQKLNFPDSSVSGSARQATSRSFLAKRNKQFCPGQWGRCSIQGSICHQDPCYVDHLQVF